MTSTELKSFYENESFRHQAVLLSVNKKIGLISNARLFIAIAFLVILYFAFSLHDLFYILPFLFVSFVMLVRYHSRLFDRKVHLENLVRVCQYEIKGLEGDLSGFDPGSDFVDGHHPYSHDLDIFGTGSLFQYLNRCHTRGGRKLLASRLSSPLQTEEDIRQHQDAVRELSAHTLFRNEIQARGMEVEELSDDRQQLKEWISHPSFLYGKGFYPFVLLIFPALTVLLLLLSFFVDGMSKFFWMAAGLQWIFLGFHLKRVNAFHQYIGRKKEMLVKYARVLKEIEVADFRSPLLQYLKSNAADAHKEMNALASLVSAFDARMNSMTNLFVNSILLYDLQCVYRLERWKERNASRLERWMDTVEENELLCSFGTFAFNNTSFVFPTINKECRLRAGAVAHPLIDASERVANDIDMDSNGSVVIITGANMAGKSTFLRTLGINVVLALNGAPVCAGDFECPIIGLRSGMRTADSLKEHQSYFYAELNRLRSIIDDLKTGRQLLILLDEILKGTNSTDKQAGSVALVKQLKDYPALVVIATHDLELGRLQKEFPHQVRNFCFEPTISGDQLFFDYKLMPGIAEKMNATFLMKKMGIIPD